MVGLLLRGAGMLPFLLFAEAATREKLPPPTRAAAIMALIGIALLGMLLVVIILLGGHWVRRQGSYRRGASVPPDRRPILGGALSESMPERPDQTPSDETTSGAAETVITRDTRKVDEPSS
jgi:hypothetical protein